MKKTLFILLALAGLATACTLPFTAPPTPTSSILGPATLPPGDPAIPSTPGAPAFQDPSGQPAEPSPAPTSTLTPTPTPLPAVRVAAGDQALFNGDWEAAIPAYQEAWNAAAGSDPAIQSAALLGIGRAYYLARDYATALNTLRDLTQNYPDSGHHAEAYFYMGMAYEALDRYIEAADAYLEYLARRTGKIDAYVYERRGDMLMAAGDYPSALIDYRAAYQSPRLGNTLDLEIKMARAYAITGDTATALIMYKDIYNRADSRYTKAQMDWLMAQIYTAQEQTDLAYAAYLDAIANFPEAYDSYQGLIVLVDAGYAVDELSRGIVDYYAEQYGVAVAAFDRYLGGAPADPATAYYFKGQSMVGLTNYFAAIDAWDEIIQSYPSSALYDEAWEQKAYILWAYLDDYTQAAQTLVDFVEANSQHPRAAEFLFDAARVHERAGRLQEAADLWDRVATDYPTSEYAYRSLFLEGIAYYRIGDALEAETVFTRAHTLVPTSGESAAVYFWIGKSQKAQGDDAAARLTWEQTTHIDPTGYYSERARDLLSDRAAFAPPETFEIGVDWQSERVGAEDWLRSTFVLPPDMDLSGLGSLTNDPRFQRGEEFWRLGLYDEARQEFESLRQAVELDVTDTYRLMNYFLDIGLYRSAIFAARQVLNLAGMNDAATQSAPAYFNHIRFGTYYLDLVFPAAQENDFHPLFVWSVMRQESFFEGFINSPAGARGLMQIIPATGQSVADQFGWPPNFSPDDLYRPVVSVRLGVEYLEQQRTALGDIYVALAAYNGGPGNAAAWQGLAPSDPDLFLEVIRYDETRTYIKRIYEMYTIYRNLYTRMP